MATGFHRNTMLNEEGGIDPLEFRFYAMTDRVATTGTVWLGLTVGCAQCHTHKFDPIPHREYYQFMGLLNNADEPEMPVPTVANDRAPAWNRKSHRRDDGRPANRFPIEGSGKTGDAEGDGAGGAGERISTRSSRSGSRARRPRPRDGRCSTQEGNLERAAASIEPDGSVIASGDQSKRDVYTVQLKSG